MSSTRDFPAVDDLAAEVFAELHRAVREAKCVDFELVLELKGWQTAYEGLSRAPAGAKIYALDMLERWSAYDLVSYAMGFVDDDEPGSDASNFWMALDYLFFSLLPNEKKQFDDDCIRGYWLAEALAHARQVESMPRGRPLEGTLLEKLGEVEALHAGKAEESAS